jgi:hypothetical protein
MKVRLFLALMVAVATVGLSASTGAANDGTSSGGSTPGVAICPMTAQIMTSEACYWPSVNISVSPSSIQPGQSATVTWSVSGADPAIGCSKGGAWSGSISVDGGGNASGSSTVSPSSGTHTYAIVCPANPAAGYGETVLTVSAAPPPPPDHVKFVHCRFNASVVSNMPVAVSGFLFGNCLVSHGTYLLIRSTTCIQRKQWPDYPGQPWTNRHCASNMVWGLGISHPIAYKCDYTTLLMTYRIQAVVVVTDLSTGQSGSKVASTPWVGPGTCF